MTMHSFTLIVGGGGIASPQIADQLYEAGLSDALLSSFDGDIMLDVDREAPTLAEAVKSAVRDVENSTAKLKVTDIKPAKAKAVANI